jgi:hypothetical protein
MLNKLKCLLKGHRFLMDYYPAYACYYPRDNDRCVCCNKVRGINE